MPSQNTRSNAAVEQFERVKRELCTSLEKQRARISEEISSYPAPIPACDAQFNYLLEARRGIARELARLNDLQAVAQADSTKSISRFIEESAYLEDDARRELRAQLKRTQ
ncbi:MAG TPA: hypothetical protein VIT83_06890 [Gammaproteobacteria bacterium]